MSEQHSGQHPFSRCFRCQCGCIHLMCGIHFDVDAGRVSSEGRRDPRYAAPTQGRKQKCQIESTQYYADSFTM
jgi:hypothetical protein